MQWGPSLLSLLVKLDDYKVCRSLLDLLSVPVYRFLPPVYLSMASVFLLLLCAASISNGHIVAFTQGMYCQNVHAVRTVW